MYFFKNKKTFIIVLTLLLLMFSSNNLYAVNEFVHVNPINLIPVRETFEDLGFRVIWSHENKNVLLINDDNEFLLTSNKGIVDINKRIFDMVIIQGIAYINLDYLNNIGFKYEYINQNTIKISQQVNIGSKVPIIKSEELKEDYLEVLNNNKPKMLFFWASWCPYCTEYIKEFNHISKDDYLGFEIIAINIDEKENTQQIEEIIKKSLFNVKNIMDPNKEIYNYYKPNAIPTTYIINDDGIVIDLIVGAISKDDIIHKLNNY